MDSALKAQDALTTTDRRSASVVLQTQNSNLKTQNLPCPNLLPALATGALLFASYFPLDCGWLAWLALVPLLCVVRGRACARRTFFCAWAGGLVFFWPALQWMRVADPAMYFTWALLATYCALYLPLGVLLVRFLDRRTQLPLVVTVPAVWVALEFLRSHLATGFSWYLLGHTQHDFLAAIQIADLGGVYAVSLLVAAVNALLFEALYARRWFRAFLALREPSQPVGRRVLLGQALAVAALLGASLTYGEWRLRQNDFAPGPTIALVQSNLALRIKNDAWSGEPEAESGSDAMRRQQVRLTDLAMPLRPELVVWPETSWPDEWAELAPDDGGRSQPFINCEGIGELREHIMERWHTDTLPGMNAVIWARQGEQYRQRDRLNSAVLITAEGQAGGRYDKIHRVPFGEYIPLRDWLPFMEWLSPYDFDYSIRPGENLTRFALGQYHFGVLICYEDTVSYLAREYARTNGSQPAADFLLNNSNDGWFEGTAEHAQHLAICRFHAIEARRSIGRSVNMGISALVDPNGRVLAPQVTTDIHGTRLWELRPGATDLPVSRWHEFQTVPGVLIASVPIDHRVSQYARFGDWLPWAGWLVVAGGLAIGLLRGRRQSSR
jgi:apolipoprotein N-acyltransferase